MADLKTDPTPIRPINYGRAPTDSAWAEVNRQTRRWARGTFTRENIISNLKTLAWVLPLTFLIWVYAEREQIATYKDEPLPFELVSLDPNRIVTLNRNQDKNLIVDLQGPQARVQDVLQKIRGGQHESPRGIRLEMPQSFSPNREQEIITVDLLRAQKIFSDYGITVVSCQPSQLLVTIDEMVDRDAKISVPPSIKNVEKTSTFEPATIKIRGPKSKLDQATGQDGQLVVYANLSEDLLRRPGHRDLQDVALQLPPNLNDDRITIASGTRVKAALDIRAADVSDVIKSMPIDFVIPLAVWEKMSTGALQVDRTIFRHFLTDVHVTGPQQVIEAMKRPEFAPRPRALLDVALTDVGEIKQKPLTFVDLPDGVKISDEDRKQTVAFRLVDKGTSD
ncbi:MAG TPA: hypothetical protein VF669_18690 [Tepidisphaeraceae bacterium]|jgi:hypothetical protein